LLELTPPASAGKPWAKAIRVGDLKLIEVRMRKQLLLLFHI
jgi:hypothetical protein